MVYCYRKGKVNNLSKQIENGDGKHRKTRKEKKMRKEKMVTRTVVSTKANTLCMDMTDKTNPVPCNHVFTIPGTFDDSKSLLKVIKKSFETENLIPVAIISTENDETLYGMTESDFIKYSVILDPKTRKLIEE